MPPIVAAGLLGIMVFCLTAFILLARAKKSEPSAPAVPRINRRKEPRVPISPR